MAEQSTSPDDQAGGDDASPAGDVAAPENASGASGGAAPPMPDLGVTLALSDEAASTIDMLGDVDLCVTVELGRTEMLVEDVLRLAAGSVVELDKLAGDPVDVYVNDRLIARGEVLVLNDNFCIRISEIVDDLHEQAQAAIEELQQEGEAA